jgi:hypothetical protein
MNKPQLQLRGWDYSFTVESIIIFLNYCFVTSVCVLLISGGLHTWLDMTKDKVGILYRHRL